MSKNDKTLFNDFPAGTEPFPNAETAWFWCVETSEALHSAIAFVIIDAPEKAGNVINAMSNLSTIWTVGLSVLGIYVYKRSREKIASKS